MRTILLIVGTFILLIAGFLVYLGFQPRIVESAKVALEGSEPLAGRMPEKGSMIGPGTGAWVKQYDRQGRLEYQFRSDVYDPRSDGMVYVTRPVIQFFMGGGQILQIEGVDGIVSKPPGADRDSLAGAPVDAPRYGNLRHVTAKIFSSAADLARGAQNLTMTMTNGQFDNDTFRLFTQEFTEADGHVVHPDEVPVTVVSKDYQFDGSGLVMYWDDLDKRLKSLDIAHGKQLTIYNASAFSVTTEAPTTQPAAAVATSSPPVAKEEVAAAAAPVQPPQEPTIAPAAPRQSTPPAVPQTQPQSHDRYFATFNRNVRIYQNGERVIGGVNLMTVDFAVKGQSEEASTQPAQATIPSRPTAPPAAVASTANPSPAPPAAAAATMPSATTRSATTRPQQPPMLVYWDGPLHVVPTDPATAPPLEDGKSIVHLVGTPVMVRQPADSQQQSTDVQCADLFYRTADSGGTMTGNDLYPLVITQHREAGAPSVITGLAAEFSRLNHLATIQGAGSAKLPDPNDPKSVLDAHWAQSCVVHLADSAQGQMEIESADLSGDVRVNHPRFDLNSRDLTLRFDTSAPRSGGEGKPGAKTGAAQQQLREALAQGDAACTVHDPDHPPRHIVAQRLQVLTDRDDQGQLFAKQVLADGAVEADQDQQKLQADHLRIALLPKPRTDTTAETTAPSTGDMSSDAELQQLIASGNVRVRGKDQSFAQGDFLQLDKVAGHSRISIRGSPAVVANKDSTLVGPEIRVWPDKQISSVVGAGKLDTTQQPTNPNAKPRPLHVTWAKSAAMDGTTNDVLIAGEVAAVSTPPDGPTDRAQGGRLLLHLSDVPTTQPADRSPTAQPQDQIGGSDFNFMRNKQVQSFTFLDAAQMDSTLIDDHGVKLSELNIRGERIDFDNTGQKLTVPGAGIMLAYKHQVAATQPSSFGGEGMTRFDWQKKFVFDQAARTATIEGGVVIQHVDEGKDPRQVRLDAPLVRATFESQGATRPDQNDEQAAMQLRQMTASGGVTVKTIDKTITAGTVEYIAAKDQLICRAGEQGTVHLVDELHPAGIDADEVWLNVKANTIEKIVNLSARGR